MSKERLKIIERIFQETIKHLDDSGNVTNYPAFNEGAYKITLEQTRWLLGYAKELAERAQELEKENIGLKQDLKNATEQLESVSDVVWKGDSSE